MAAPPAGVSATHPSLVSSENVLKVHSVQASRSLMKIDNISPSIDPWHTLSK